jgi:hypothetical protein
MPTCASPELSSVPLASAATSPSTRAQGEPKNVPVNSHQSESTSGLSSSTSFTVIAELTRRITFLENHPRQPFPLGPRSLKYWS